MLPGALRFALRFRVLVAACAAGLIALGLIELPTMPADAVPELSQAPVLEVQTEAPGLSGVEVEQYLTVPMENNLLDGVMGVWDVRSQSLPGVSVIDLYFDPGTTMLHARQLVEERLTNSFSLPAVAKPPQLIQPLSSSSRALMIGLSSRTLTPLELSYLARWIVKPRLSGVSGVANVAIFGQQDRQIQVQVDPARLAARHLTLQQVIDTAGNAQLVSPLTYLEGSAPGTGGFLDGPNQRLDIRPVLPLGAPRDLAAVPVSDASGNPTLGSVANVVEAHQPMIGGAITGSGSGLVLVIQKLPSASVLGVTKAVEAALADLRPALAGVRIDDSFFRPARYVSDALHNLAVALVIAAALALLALVALLLEARAVFITALSVALSMVAAVLVLDWRGYTLNLLVALGLVLASAVLVDDAVAGTRALLVRLQAGATAEQRPPLSQVVLEGLGELRGTLGYGALIVLLSIAPLFFAKGVTASYLHPMALAFALAVIASTLVSVTVTPAIAMLVYARGRPRPRAVALATRLRVASSRVILSATALPRWLLACVAAAGLAGLISIPFLSLPAPPRLQDRDVVVQWSGPPGASLSEMSRITQRTIASLRALPSVAGVAATLGRAVSGDRLVNTNDGQIYVALKSSANYERATGAIRGVVGSVPGMSASVSTYEDGVQSGVLAPHTNQLTVRVYGESYPELRTLAGQVQGLMAHLNGLGDPQIQMPVEQPEIQIGLNDSAAHDAGVLPGDARRQASTLVSGLTVGNFFEQQAVFDVVVVGTPSVRQTARDVRNLPIDTSGGRTVPLSSIATVGVASDPVDIQHEALSRYVDVTAPVYVGGMGAARAAIQQRLGQLTFPLDYHAEVVGDTPENATSHFKFLSFVFAALLGMLLLFQAALGSWRLAIALLVVLPVSLCGGLLVALAGGWASSLGADVGLLAVFAFAARQGLLAVAAIRRCQASPGGELTPELVAEGARSRLSSSVTTTVVAAAALAPFVVLGDVAGNEVAHVAAAVMLGGLVSSALVTQLLVPAICLAVWPPAPPVPIAGDELSDELSGRGEATTNGAGLTNGLPADPAPIPS